MRIFDTVSNENVTVIDVRAGLLYRRYAPCATLDSYSKKDQFGLVVFHILGASVSSLNEIEDTSAFTDDASYSPKKLHQQHQLLRMGPSHALLLF